MDIKSKLLLHGTLPRLAPWAGLSLVVGVFLVRTAAHFEYTPDDTYIYLQYARNIIQHHEVAFNSGEPSYGITSPLWLALICISSWFVSDPMMAAKILDAMAAAISIVVLFLLQDRFSRNRFVALAAAAAFSTHVWFLRWAGSGMETSLATLLSILALEALTTKRFHRGALFCGLLVLTRPEAAVLVVVGFILVWRGGGISSRNLLWAAVEFLLVLLPWNLYAYRTFGSILPNTALAKSGLRFSLNDAVSTLVDIVQTMGASDGIPLTVLLSFAVLLSVKRKSDVRLGRKQSMDMFLMLAWVASLPVFYVATGTNVVSRYLMLISPPVVLLAFSVPFFALSNSRFGSLRSKFVMLLTVFIVVYDVGLFEFRVRPQINAFAAGMQSCLVYIGNWLRDNTPRGARVLAGDVGAIGYYSERRICDAAGLVSPALLPLARSGYNTELLRHEREYRARCQAEYIIESSRTLDPPRPPGLKPLVTRTMHGLRMTSNDPVYYTVLRVEGLPE